MSLARAIANPNIAMIKYWGNINDELRLPANGSISFSLAGLETVTEVRFDPVLEDDELQLNNRPASAPELGRVSRQLDLIRDLAGIRDHATVSTGNNFPAGAGIASSASAFAALSLAAAAAAGLELNQQNLSRLARRGSGSAARSIHPGFVELFTGENDDDSYAEMIAPPDHWDLVDLIAVISQAHKPVGSSQGHLAAPSSPLQAARVGDAQRRLDQCRQAIMDRDFESLADIVELDSNLMHAVMITSSPPLFYWEPESITLMRAISGWRKEGLEVCYTLDAGPNVHCLATGTSVTEVEKQLGELPFIQQILRGQPGAGARLVDTDD
jgi:diphosphomevalonate decarboxylase